MATWKSTLLAVTPISRSESRSACLGLPGVVLEQIGLIIQYHHSLTVVLRIIFLPWLIVGWWLENSFKEKQFNFSEVIAWLA